MICLLSLALAPAYKQDEYAVWENEKGDWVQNDDITGESELNPHQLEEVEKLFAVLKELSKFSSRAGARDAPTPRDTRSIYLTSYNT